MTSFSSISLPPVTSSLSTTQILTSTPSTTRPSPCCENGRPVMTDPYTGQSICSCQYSPASLLSAAYPKALVGDGPFPSTYPPGYLQLSADAASSLYSQVALSSAYEHLKENPETAAAMWRASLAHTAAAAGAYYPYDPTLAAYSYPGYGGMDLTSASRRKNATRETTSTLKAWLCEHRKNPYPTKGEKIMLAIITKMTLTQVSTWFANARRRLKKENKMTWSPRNRNGENSEDGKDDQDDDAVANETGESSKTDADNLDLDSIDVDHVENGASDDEGIDDDDHGQSSSQAPKSPPHLSPVTNEPDSEQASNSTIALKPKIWSLADVATSKEGPRKSPSGGGPIRWQPGLNSPSSNRVHPYASSLIPPSLAALHAQRQFESNPLMNRAAIGLLSVARPSLADSSRLLHTSAGAAALRAGLGLPSAGPFSQPNTSRDMSHLFKHPKND